MPALDANLHAMHLNNITFSNFVMTFTSLNGMVSNMKFQLHS